MPVLIVAHAEDALAARVYLSLCRRHGPRVARLVSDAELVFASAVTLHLDNGLTRCSCHLADGFHLDADAVGVVFNRFQGISPGHLDAFEIGDRDYARMELNALWLAWLAGLPCPVVNPATARGLCGPLLSNAEWLLRAARVGLPVRGWRFSSRRPREARSLGARYGSEAAAVIDAAIHGREPRLELEAVEGDTRVSTVVGDDVFGAGEQREALVALARSVGCDLLEVAWQRRAGERSREPKAWCVCGVSPVPDCGSQEVIDALGDALLELAGQRTS